MNKTSKNKLKEILKIEKKQSNLINYINIKNIGKFILYFFPITFIIFTILILSNFIDFILEFFQLNEIENEIKIIDFIFLKCPILSSFWLRDIIYKIIIISFLFLLVSFFIYSVLLLFTALKTKQALTLRLNFEKRKNKLFTSLRNFESFFNNLYRNIFIIKIVAIIDIISFILFICMLFLEYIILGLSGIGSLIIQIIITSSLVSLDLKIGNINGLQDFFKPSVHEIFLDYPINEILINHLDPLTFLKFSKFKKELLKIINPNYVKKIEKLKKGKFHFSLLLEKFLILYYLEYESIIKIEQLQKKIKQLVNINSKIFNIEKGLFIENKWYFSLKDFYRIFNFIKQKSPSFFFIIDRLHFKIKKNTEAIIKKPIYIDLAFEEEIEINKTELDLIVFLFNNGIEPSIYRLRIEAPGFKPNNILINIELKICETLTIPEDSIPLISDNNLDRIEILFKILENGEFKWFNLEPFQEGEHNINLFLEDKEGTIIYGKTQKTKILPLY